MLLEQGYQVIVKTGQAQGSFVKDYSGESERLEVISTVMDIGLVLKVNSFEIDGEGLEAKVRKFIESWPEIISEEVLYLNDIKLDLIVCDIVP